jgi:glucosamine 6-phosphate synthetase-like amidotransferase/phosphosugar isomerase protein
MASKKKAEMGRPKIEIDLDLAYELGSLQCTMAECAAVMKVNESTLKNRPDFLTKFKQGKENGKMSLRRIQWAHARRSYSMAMFLGKVYLGQREQETVDMQNLDQHLKDIATAMKERDG